MEETKTPEEKESETKGLPPAPIGGTRQIGKRKMKLLLALQKTLQGLQKKGINAGYALKQFTNYKGPTKTPTKYLSGIISELKQIK